MRRYHSGGYRQARVKCGVIWSNNESNTTFMPYSKENKPIYAPTTCITGITIGLYRKTTSNDYSNLFFGVRLYRNDNFLEVASEDVRKPLEQRNY